MCKLNVFFSLENYRFKPLSHATNLKKMFLDIDIDNL